MPVHLSEESHPDGGHLPRAMELQLEALEADAAETLRTWEPRWTPFVDPWVRREAELRLGALSDLHLSSDGGYSGAVRRRLLMRRQEAAETDSLPSVGLVGLEISGNFLFDPATLADMREGLHQAGAAPGEVGDLWLRGDRGAQGVMTETLAAWLDGCLGQVRSVEVRFERRPLAELRCPPERAPRALQTVEASLRLDAVASAGFGVSRTRMAESIRQGALRVDWRPVLSPSHTVKPGQCLQLEGRGELEITAASPTQRGRWRVQMTRR
ncbi:MAG: photosystem II S4 domain protein [Cyanobacteriota bacterium]|nr:photosystem II S4 domain protein [Cyanobacteriota bacterium]